MCVCFLPFFLYFPFSTKRERKTYTEHGKKYPHRILPPVKIYVGYLCVCVKLWSPPAPLLPPYKIWDAYTVCVCMYWSGHIFSVCMCMYMENKHEGASNFPSQLTCWVDMGTFLFPYPPLHPIYLDIYLCVCISFHFLSRSPSPSSLSPRNIKIAKLHT